MSVLEDRNPSPPPEFENQREIYRADSVGGTAISKQWVLATLMKIIQEVEKHMESKDDTPIEVNDELQDAACKLWDICADKDVAVYLLDFDIVELLYGVIWKSKSPRLTEISVGILGNMACSDRACEAISKLKHLRSVVLAMLASPDTPTLLETVRLIKICCSNQGCFSDWVDSIVADVVDFINNCRFILGSSTQGKLLGGISEILDMTFEYSSPVLAAACTEEFVGALLEATDQQHSADPTNSLHSLCHSLHSLHTISESELGRKVMESLQRNVAAVLSSLCYQWITSHPKIDYSNENRMSASEVSVSCCLSLIHLILMSEQKRKNREGKDTLSEGEDKKEKENLSEEDKKEKKSLSEENKDHCSQRRADEAKTESGSVGDESSTERIEEVDDEDRELMIKFARSVVSARGVISALAVMSALASQEENSNEFKTPLHLFKNSPRATTPVSSSLLNRNSEKNASTDAQIRTPVGSPALQAVSPGETTPTRENCGDFTPTARERAGYDAEENLHPPTVLCDLANRVLKTASDHGWITNGESPRKAAT